PADSPEPAPPADLPLLRGRLIAAGGTGQRLPASYGVGPARPQPTVQPLAGSRPLVARAAMATSTGPAPPRATPVGGDPTAAPLSAPVPPGLPPMGIPAPSMPHWLAPSAAASASTTPAPPALLPVQPRSGPGAARGADAPAPDPA